MPSALSIQARPGGWEGPVGLCTAQAEGTGHDATTAGRCVGLPGSSCGPWASRSRSGGDGLFDVDQPAWRNRPTVGQEFARVVEDDDAVAQQAPPLLGVEGDGVSRVTVGTVS